MRREMALMLLPLVVAQGCASGGLLPPGGGGPADLAAVNSALADQLATVELRSGEKVRDVEDARLTADSTTWRDGDKVRTVPTAEVSKVTRQVRRRLWSGLGWGVLAGLPVGFLVASGQRNTRTDYFSIASDNQVTAFVLTDVACGLAGMLISGALRKDRVVYVASDARAAAAPSGITTQRCRLAAAQTPAGAPAIDCALEPAGR